jgi:hypothetical protein
LEVPLSRNFIRATALFAVASLVACHGGGTIPPVAGNAALSPTAQSTLGQVPLSVEDGDVPLASPNAVRPACPRPRAGEMQCFALERVDLRSNDVDPNASHFGYGPKDLQSAYKIPPGNGTKVAVVDAYGYPHAASDLATYRKYYGLPACTTGNGCLEIRNQTGGTKPPPPNSGWDVEQALDIDMVSAACPKCKIVLVQARTAFSSDLYTAVLEAANLGAVVISNSYGIPENNNGCGFLREASDPAFSASGHVYVASAGDNGGGMKNCGGPQQPCSLSTVVCVGGTHLVHSNNKRGWSESVWNELTISSCGGPCGATGSGCSTVVKKPGWEKDPDCTRRSEADVAASASVIAPVAVFFGGWKAFGGTSVSAPLIAGIFGRAGNAATIVGPEHIWLNRTKLFDQTVGNDLFKPYTGDCASGVHYICFAQKGYDGPTGLGSPNGLGAF